MFTAEPKNDGNERRRNDWIVEDKQTDSVINVDQFRLNYYNFVFFFFIIIIINISTMNSITDVPLKE